MQNQRTIDTIKLAKEFIREKYPDVFGQIDFVNAYEKFKYSLLTGEPQVGKSAASIALAWYQSVVLNIAPVITVVNADRHRPYPATPWRSIIQATWPDHI